VLISLYAIRITNATSEIFFFKPKGPPEISRNPGIFGGIRNPISSLTPGGLPIRSPGLLPTSRRGSTRTRARIKALTAGDWVETGANLIAIGNSGTGKSHVLCAIGHALVEAGNRVLYTSTAHSDTSDQVFRRHMISHSGVSDHPEMTPSGAVW
jgi:hypothetical protein